MSVCGGGPACSMSSLRSISSPRAGSPSRWVATLTRTRSLSTFTSTVLRARLLQANEDWKSVQDAVVGIFQGKKLAEHQLCHLRQHIRNLLASKVGPFQLEYHTKQVLTRGMIILRERIRFHAGMPLLTALEETWEYFFSEVLPTVQAVFFPSRMNIRHTTLILFRDVVLLKIAIKDALMDDYDRRLSQSSGIQHMLLILQGVHDNPQPNEKQLALENLVALIVVPYLGFQGRYEGLPEPLIRSKEPAASIFNLNESINHRMPRPKSEEKFNRRPNNLMVGRYHRGYTGAFE